VSEHTGQIGMSWDGGPVTFERGAPEVFNAASDLCGAIASLPWVERLEAFDRASDWAESGRVACQWSPEYDSDWRRWSRLKDHIEGARIFSPTFVRRFRHE